MPVTAPIGMQYRPRSEAFSRALAQRRAIEFEREKLRSASQQELLKRMMEQEDAGQALDLYFRGRPQEAEQYGLVEMYKEPVDLSEYEEPGFVTERKTTPVPRAAAPGMMGLIKEDIKTSRAERTGELAEQRLLKGIRARGGETRETEGVKAGYRMAELQEKLASAWKLRNSATDIRLQIEKMRQQAMTSRATERNRAQMIASVWQGSGSQLAEMQKQRLKLNQELMNFRMALQDPETEPADRVRYQTTISELEGILGEFDENYQDLLNMRREAEQAAQFGPASRAPGQRPGPEPKPRTNPKDPLGIR